MSELLPDAQNLLQRLQSNLPEVARAAWVEASAIPPEAQWDVYQALLACLLERPPAEASGSRWNRLFPKRTSFARMPIEFQRYSLLRLFLSQTQDPRFAPIILEQLYLIADRFDTERRGRLDYWGTAVPALALRTWSLAERVPLLQALSRTLVHFPRTQAETLTQEQRKGLLVALDAPYRDVALTLHTLDLLAALCLREALPDLAHLRTAEPYTPAIAQVREAAERCLKRIEDGLSEQTLLRPISSISNDDLLRSVTPQTPSHPIEELVHPIE